jgi:phage-related protein
MSEDLFYNRDINLSGISPVNVNLFAPSYGSSVSFSAENKSYLTKDGYSNIIPNSVNSLIPEFKMTYELNQSGARSVISFLEELRGTGEFNYLSDSSVYKSIPVICNGYSLNHKDNQSFNLDCVFKSFEVPNLFNWSGGNFVANGWIPYTNGSNYQKYDVVYTGINENKLDNFFYCTQDHEASPANSPTGVSSAWTQSFFFEPDIGASNEVQFKVDEINFKNSFKKKVKTQSNISSFPISYKYTDISTKQLKSMLHFLEIKGGYRRFRHQIPTVYNRPKVFYCQEWSHTWKYVNAHDLTVNLTEDPLGIIPKGI